MESKRCSEACLTTAPCPAGAAAVWARHPLGLWKQGWAAFRGRGPHVHSN